MTTYRGNVITISDGLKMRLRVDANFTTSGIVWTPTVEVTSKNTKNKKHKVVLKWKSYNGTQYSNTIEKEFDTVTTYAIPTTSGAKSRTYPNYKIGHDISITCEGKTSRIATGTIVSSLKPPAPTIKVEKTSSTTLDVTVTATGSTSAPVNEIVLESTDNPSLGSWSEVGTHAVSPVLKDGDSTSHVFNITGISEGEVIYYRAYTKASNNKQSNPVNSDKQISAPSTSSLTVSDTGLLTWTEDADNIVSGAVQGWTVRRSANGGSYQDIATIRAEVDVTDYSYQDTSIIAGVEYDYQLVAFGEGGQSVSGSSGGTTVSTVPNSPREIKAYRDVSDNVVISIIGASNIAETVKIDRRIDGGSWVNIASESYPLETYTDTPLASDSIEYRVCYANDKGNSSYVVSNVVMVKSKPQAPLLVSPIGSVVAIDDGVAKLQFLYRPTDGSPLREAQIKYRVNQGAWVTVTLDTVYYELDISEMSAGTIEWTARTLGSHADYGDWADTVSFTVVTKPSLVITSPLNAETIEELPIVLEWEYSDESGELTRLTLDIEGTEFELPTGETEYAITKCLFDNNRDYLLKVTAESSTGLRVTQIVSVMIGYEEVSLEGGLLPIPVQNGNEVDINIARDIEGEPVEIQKALLYRLHKREVTLLGEVREGDVVVDKYAPLNIDYSYKLVMLTEDGEMSIVEVGNNLESNEALVIFGDKVAKAKWNPTSDVTLERPERVEVRYSGRKYPVSYDTNAMEEKQSFSAVILDREELWNFEEMMAKGGRGIWKSLDGDVFEANFTFSHSSEQYKATRYWNCKLDVTRIEG